LRKQNEFTDNDGGGVDAEKGHDVNLQEILHSRSDSCTGCKSPDGDQCSLTCTKDHRRVYVIPNLTMKVGIQAAYSQKRLGGF
jgi:hypothetical protein